MLSQFLSEGVQGRLWARDGREHVSICQDRSPEHNAIDTRLNIGCVKSLTGTYRNLHLGSQVILPGMSEKRRPIDMNVFHGYGHDLQRKRATAYEVCGRLVSS